MEAGDVHSIKVRSSLHSFLESIKLNKMPTVWREGVGNVGSIMFTRLVPFKLDDQE